MLLLSLVLGGGNTALFAAMVFALGLTPAVIIRAQVQSLNKREFIEAARVGGMHQPQTVITHTVPNCPSV